jgi:drug/metabolite transporter (DMT)-like permease
LIGVSPILVKLVSLSPTAVAIYRCGLGALFLLLLILFKREGKLLKVPWSQGRYLLASGLFFAADLYVWHRSIVYTGAGLATILANTQVFYVSLVGVFLFKEKFGLKHLLAIVLAFLGVVLLGSERLESFNQLAQLRGSNDSRVEIFWICFVTTVALSVVSLFAGDMALPSKEEWGWMVALALLVQVAGWLWIGQGMRVVAAWKTGLVLLFQPALAAILGAIIFGEYLSLRQILGAVLVLVAILAIKLSPQSSGK